MVTWKVTFSFTWRDRKWLFSVLKDCRPHRFNSTRLTRVTHGINKQNLCGNLNIWAVKQWIGWRHLVFYRRAGKQREIYGFSILVLSRGDYSCKSCRKTKPMINIHLFNGNYLKLLVQKGPGSLPFCYSLIHLSKTSLLDIDSACLIRAWHHSRKLILLVSCFPMIQHWVNHLSITYSGPEIERCHI